MTSENHSLGVVNSATGWNLCNIKMLGGDSGQLRQPQVPEIIAKGKNLLVIAERSEATNLDDGSLILS